MSLPAAHEVVRCDVFTESPLAVLPENDGRLVLVPLTRLRPEEAPGFKTTLASAAWRSVRALEGYPWTRAGRLSFTWTFEEIL